MNYIHPNNKKAIEHFKKLGCTLTPIERPDMLTRLAWADDNYCLPTYTHWYAVTGGNLPEMGGKRFHQYLKDHGLLMDQQD